VNKRERKKEKEGERERGKTASVERRKEERRHLLGFVFCFCSQQGSIQDNNVILVVRTLLHLQQLDNVFIGEHHLYNKHM